ncbi:MAG: hypothetical protein ACI4QI_02670 [Candidatus Coproplasma sp.]
MKANKVLSIIFAIALFAAFVGMVTCLYNAIDMLTYTTFIPNYNSNVSSLEVNEIYYELQKPLATILLVASIISLVGVVAAGLGLFFKKTVVKAISLIVSVLITLAFIGFMIWAYNVWFSYLKDCKFYSSDWFNIVDAGIPYFISSYKRYISMSIGYSYYDGQVAQYALYSAVMSALLQQLIYFAVIAGIATYYFVSPIIEAKRNKKAQTAESTETVSPEAENTQVDNNQNN